MPTSAASAETFTGPCSRAETMRTRLVSLKARNSSATCAALGSSRVVACLTVITTPDDMFRYLHYRDFSLGCQAPILVEHGSAPARSVVRHTSAEWIGCSKRRL